MTSAKPQSMAAQTDAPDDLIAELAKLMADDARADQSAPATSVKPAPVRIPGGDVSSATRPDFGAEKRDPAPIPTVRIPGDSVKVQADDARIEPSVSPEPFRFDFDLNLTGKPSGPATPLAPEPKAEESDASEPASEQAASPNADALDHDGLADLIAAELANELNAADAEPLPVVEGPARGEDNFGVPPVFGLSAPVEQETQPAPESVSVVEPVIAAPEPVEPGPGVHAEPLGASRTEPELPRVQPEPGHSDPLADIERLVGPAVRRPQEEAEASRLPSPALRSLATPTLPPASREAEVSGERHRVEPTSVDEAILAAAAATGARVEWVDEPGSESGEIADDIYEQPVRRRRQFVMSRAVAGPLVAVGLLGIAGFGLYWVLGQGGTPSGPAPLLVADTNAVKEVPEPAPANTQQSVVFNEISGTSTAEEEQIVPRDQADEAAINEATSPIMGSGVLTGGDDTAIDPNQDGLVNRKVRTVTVRPDGTIISGEDSLAGASILPVDRPNVPEVPGANFSTPDLIASTIAAAETPEPAAAAQPEATPVPDVALVQPGAVVPVVDAAGTAIQGRTVTVPMTRPDDFAQMATSALSAAAVPAAGAQPLAAPAQATPAQPAPAQTATPVSTGGAAAYVQISSQRSEDAARQSAQAMMTRYGPLFGGATPEIQRADLGERGIYYRVLVPAASRADAANICTNLRAAGGDCLLP